MGTGESAKVGYQCDVEGCETEIVGLDDGWEFSRGLVCASCIKTHREHGHWPDEDALCVECGRVSA